MTYLGPLTSLNIPGGYSWDGISAACCERGPARLRSGTEWDAWDAWVEEALANMKHVSFAIFVYICSVTQAFSAQQQTSFGKIVMLSLRKGGCSIHW